MKMVNWAQVEGVGDGYMKYVALTEAWKHGSMEA
jgi:hypothetical protein